MPLVTQQIKKFTIIWEHTIFTWK